ncbi:PREDICTED: two-component response regulator-like APRR7 [Ipomoea nil]|uniref:two-component response regulator-like APRR7 n=1 Tax=Ipomoea nil TaxID=35883 RepID=UPI000900D8E1|nr:PREDICTED: two-component response regulator-like APRR7 [Ipomoea nil]XP_019184965.1 PREDICTED: two-component response regulator-like APRR7 [Ipomoea nil]
MEIHAKEEMHVTGDDDKEFMVDGASEDAKDVGNKRALPAEFCVREQQKRGETTIFWEMFLHVTSIRVLVVEIDDSTRRVISALLMNCNYEVIGASNGLEAWKILEDETNQIDLVLSEVVIPYLSGLDLLCKIRSHKPCSNIPVIMMSSHDSIHLVFKCLSNGAVDFLVKPVRKNELKNLWQHVWRIGSCHNSNGSVSGSGKETKSFDGDVGEDSRSSSDLKTGGGHE